MLLTLAPLNASLTDPKRPTEERLQALRALAAAGRQAYYAATSIGKYVMKDREFRVRLDAVDTLHQAGLAGRSAIENLLSNPAKVF